MKFQEQFIRLRRRQQEQANMYWLTHGEHVTWWPCDVRIWISAL